MPPSKVTELDFERLEPGPTFTRPGPPRTEALRNRLYYQIKGLIPQRLRLAIRRHLALQQLRRPGLAWPIDHRAGCVPSNWPGWPEGKQFALVLTHDVERAAGLARCRQLMQLELDAGVRSSFNFVPEGNYELGADLRAELAENGFEVAVHDLRHDGKLYRSHERFSANARRINQYLRNWDAVGFRSGFMMRNLRWLHELDLEYDSSTFDTDPFEPQPDGVQTIFPFWVPATETASDTGRLQAAAESRGYVELPYTLAQDSTLFLLLRQKTIEIWKQKLDWIVEKGGMALLLTHPDYMNFSGSNGPGPYTYPASLYREFLDYVQTHYRGQFWHALPREVAGSARPHQAAPRMPSPAPTSRTVAPEAASICSSDQAAETDASDVLRSRHVAAVVFSQYPSDPRPRRAAEALAQLGMEVEVICLAGEDGEPRQEVYNSVKITRLPIKHRRGGKFGYVYQYASFLLASAWILFVRSWSRRYSLVHVHNMPDVLVFSALIPRLRGAKVILDLHDPMPELMQAIFGLKSDSGLVRVLMFLEKWSIRFTDAVLTVNQACKKLFTARSCSAEKIGVIMNSPDEQIFEYREASTPPPVVNATRPFVIMYHGSLVERHGLDLAVQALATVQKSIPDVELRVYGKRTPFLDQVMSSLGDSQKSVRYLGTKNLDEIAAAIRECDLGIIPNRRSIFTEINTPTRIFEYLSQGKPVLAPSAPGIEDYFGPDDLIFFELGDATDLAARIEFVIRHPGEVEQIIKRGQEVYRNHKWSSERLTFVRLVSELVSSTRFTPGRREQPKLSQE